jgi:hypothetical protein
MTLAQCIERLVKRHGGVRAVARTAGIDPGYVTRLRNGERAEPGDAVLAALGLERVVTYRLIKVQR